MKYPVLIVGIIGWLFIAGGLIALMLNTSISVYGTRTQGTVVEIDDQMGSFRRNTRVYAPKIEYYDSYGEKRHFTDTIYLNQPLHKVGDTIAVVHWNLIPGYAMIAGALRMYMLPIGFMLIGCLLAGVQHLLKKSVDRKIKT